MDFIIWPLLALGGMGAIFGLALGFFQKLFAVEGNPAAVEILAELPGANCGGCGFAGCKAYAEAAAEGDAPPNACPVGGQPVAEKIGKILGVDAGEVIRKVAFVKCGGSCEKAKSRYEYNGIYDCTAAAVLAGGGSKQCQFGCVGLGSCIQACQFGAIRDVNGIAVIEPDKCVACGACLEVCPKALIELVPYASGAKVLCNSTDKGKELMEKCEIGCIGCKLCQKACEADAVVIENNLARINYEKCTNCGECVIRCPRESIRFSLRRKHLLDQ